MDGISRGGGAFDKRIVRNGLSEVRPFKTLAPVGTVHFADGGVAFNK
jgi:hypothetical protein